MLIESYYRCNGFENSLTFIEVKSQFGYTVLSPIYYILRRAINVVVLPVTYNSMALILTSKESCGHFKKKKK